MTELPQDQINAQEEGDPLPPKKPIKLNIP